MVHVSIVEASLIWELRVIVAWAVRWAWGHCGLLCDELEEDSWADFETGVVFKQLFEHCLFFIRE